MQATKSVGDARADLHEAMVERWRQEFPSGHLPDDLAARVYEFEREFWHRLNEARRSR